MAAYQTFDILAIPEAQQLVEALQDWISDRSSERDLYVLEGEIQRALSGIGRATIRTALTSLDTDSERIEVDGQLFVKQKEERREGAYGTPWGEVQVERNLYHPITGGGVGQSICPVELRAGIVEGTWTPRAAEVMVYATAIMTPGEAEGLFDKIGGFTPSRSSLDRLPKALSKRWEPNREQWEEAIRNQEDVPVQTAIVNVSLDGVMTPMRDGERTEKPEKVRPERKCANGPAGYRESAVGTVSFYDSDGARLATTYYGRMPEAKKVTLHQQLEKETSSLGTLLTPLDLVLSGDGALENWRILGEIKATLLASGVKVKSIWGIVDFWHATEHLKTATDEYFGHGSPESEAAYLTLKDALKDEDDGVDQVIVSLAKYRDAKKGKHSDKLATELGYFEKNKEKMRYSMYQRLNLPIGTGVTEAGCKTLVTQRFKRSGMRWGCEGGQAILTFRALLKSQRWDPAWKLVSGGYKSRIVAVTTKVDRKLEEAA